MERSTNSPAITVLMSAHNAEKTVREAINSILNQTETDFEFIIINDGSTDNTRSILESYTDTRIRVITNQENIGLTKSLNLGLQQARSEYIARMDADDICLPDRLAKQKAFLDSRPEIAGVGGGNVMINEIGKVIGQKKTITDPELIKFHLVLKNQMIHPTMLLRRSIIEKVGSYNENFPYAQDYELWSRLLASGQKLANLAEPVIKYRFHTTSITQGENKDRAYALATAVSTKNIQSYLPVTNDDCAMLLNATHRQQVNSWRGAKKIRQLLGNLAQSYIAKENPSASNKKVITEYINFLRRQVWRWYLKNLIIRIIS